MRWFSFNEQEIKRIDDYEIKYLSCEILSELIVSDTFMKNYQGEERKENIKGYINKGIISAHRLNIYEEGNIKNYIFLCAGYPYTLMDQEIINIITDTSSNESLRLSQLEKLIS